MFEKKVDIYSDGLSGGGAEIFIYNLIDNRRFPVNDVYSFQNQKSNIAYRKINYVSFFRFVFNSCKEGNYVYVHLSKSSFLAYIYLFFFEGHSKNFIFHEHTIPEYYYEANNLIKKGFSYIFNRLRSFVYSRYSVKVILGSEKQKQELEAKLNNSKSAKFYYFKLPLMKVVKNDEFKFNSFEKGRPIKFYSVSRIENIKRIDLCITALSIVSRSYPQIQFEFDIFGVGSQVENLKKISKTFTSENFNIRYRGYLNDYNDVKEHHYLLVASEIEGFGLSILEALLLKKIVIGLNRRKIYSYQDFDTTFQNFFLSNEDSFNSFVKEIEENVIVFLKNEIINRYVFKANQSWPSITTATSNLISIIYEK